MKKLIPFDITKAKAGAKVVTETGLDVEILNYDLGNATLNGYVLGRYKSDVDPDYSYEVWPSSGKFSDPVGHPPDLMIEVEVSDVDYEEEPLLKELFILQNRANNLEQQVTEKSVEVGKLERHIKTLEQTALAKHQHQKEIEEELAIWRHSHDNSFVVKLKADNESLTKALSEMRNRCADELEAKAKKIHELSEKLRTLRRLTENI